MKFFKKKKVIEKQLPEKEVIFFTLHNLMLGVFIDVICDGKFEGLIKSGNPTREQVLQHWDALYLQYSDTIGTSDYDLAVDDEKLILSTRAKIELVSAAVKVLVQFYVHDLAVKINEDYNFNIQYFEDPETYYKQFKKIEGQLKLWKVELEIALLKNPNKDNKGDKVSRETFDNIVNELSLFAGYSIQEDTISVSRFALLLKKLKAHNEAEERRLKMKVA